MSTIGVYREYINQYFTIIQQRTSMFSVDKCKDYVTSAKKWKNFDESLFLKAVASVLLELDEALDDYSSDVEDEK